LPLEQNNATMSVMTDSETETALVDLPARRSNRPVRFFHYIELALMRGLLGFFRLMSADAASALAGKFLRYTGPLIRPASLRAERNLEKIYPGWTPDQVRQEAAHTRKILEEKHGVVAEPA